MTVSTDDVATLREQIRSLTDRAEISQLLDRYVMHLDHDRHHDDWLASVFTEDVHLVFPMGQYKGLDGLAEFQAMARGTFARTHHISANHMIVLDGDRADVRAHLMAVHVRKQAAPGEHFDIGGHYEGEVVRTAAGWRLRRFVFDLVWNAGQAPGH